MKNLFAISLLFLSLFACEKTSIEGKELALHLPNTPFNYQTGDEIATLGRVLFYDKQLSINNSISCASCHKQAIAFSDNKKFSRGFDNNLTLRNSMPIQNLASFTNSFGNDISFGTSSGLFWDGRGVHHENGVLQPIINHIEMGIPDIPYLAEKLSQIEYYPELFQDAFFSDDISSDKIGIALRAFTHSITSTETKLDLARRGREELSPQEVIGQELFMTKYDCNSCHQVEDPQGYIFAGTFANIGLEENYSDGGLEETTERSFDNGKFKIPSLRNVALTAPYMHDGRFETLEEVIDHYNTGVVKHPNLDFRLQNEDGTPKRPNITEGETQAIIAFLGTMTDYQMIEDPKFSNPFRIQ